MGRSGSGFGFGFGFGTACGYYEDDDAEEAADVVDSSYRVVYWN